MPAHALTLYDTTDALLAVRAWFDDPEHADLLLEAGGEIPTDLDALLTAAEGAFADKVERVALYVRELTVSATATTEESERLALRAARVEGAIARLRAYLHREMERAGAGRIASERVTVRVQRNSTPSVRVAGDPVTLPEAWRVWVAPTAGYYRVDTTAIVRAWRAGEAVPETITITTGTHLRIE